MKQLQLPKGWIADALENSDSDEDYVEDDEAKKRSKTFYWTRVKSLSQIEEQKLMVYDSAPDLDFDRNLR